MEVIDTHLQRYLPLFPWCIRSTKEYINEISCIEEEELIGTEEEPIWLGTGDVTAFYTNVHIPTAVSRIKKVIRDNAQVDSLVPAESIEELVNLVAKANCFEFIGKSFHQIAGLAMSSPCSATIASLYLATVEKSLLIDHVYIHRGDKRVVSNSRYIDD